MKCTWLWGYLLINSVYSQQLQKWIWIDPTNNAYVKDENGNLLSIAEVRDRLIHNKPLVLNEDANWNNQKKQTKSIWKAIWQRICIGSLVRYKVDLTQRVVLEKQILHM